MAGLEEAIAVTKQAVELTPPNTPEYPKYLNNLSNRLSERYTRTGTQADLEQALIIAQQAVDLTPIESPYRPSCLNNLGSRLAAYYTWTTHFTYLEQAITVGRQAVVQTPSDSPERASFLINLATQLSSYYVQTGDLSSLQEAIDASQEAINLTPVNASDYPSLLNNLASHLRTFHERTGQSTYLEQTRNLYKQACESGKEVRQTITLLTARNWGNWALIRKAWPESVEAYSYGIDAIDYLYQIQFQRKDKETWLQAAGGVHARSAYAGAQLNQLQQAVTILERGRAFLLSETLELNRTDLERLPDLGYPNLYGQYQDILNHLWVLEHQKATQIGDWKDTRAKLDKVIIRIQQIPGYEDVFRPPTFTDDVITAIQDDKVV